MQWINRAWNGREPLWRVFWLYTFAPLCAVLILGGVINKIDMPDAALAVRHLFWLKLVVFPYTVFSSYLVYQCLHNIRESTLYARGAMMCCIYWTLWLLHSISLGPHLPPPPPPRQPLIVQRTYYSPTGRFLSSSKEAKANDACVRKMDDYALAHKVNPQNYIANNQDYLQKCTEYLMNREVPSDKQ